MSEAPTEATLVTRRERVAMVAFTVACGLMYLAWALKIPYNHAPDEAMRYRIVEFILQHGSLPSGMDPEIRDPLWGTSYAFQPILSYLVGAAFATVAGWFGGGAAAQVLAARLVSVLCGTGTVAVCVVLGRRFFTGPWRWLFPVSIGLLPQFAFLNAYVNNDALALFSSALVVLAWVRGIESGWTVRNSLFLGFALAVCTLSYYNTYGFLLVTVVLCVGERAITWRTGADRRTFWRATWVAVGIVTATWAVLAAWWFVRNGILYDGDFLGLATSNASTELYGAPEIRAGVRSGLGRGWTFFEMVFRKYWLIATLMSIVGMFGYMLQWLPLPSYWWWWFTWAVAAVGCGALAVRRLVPRWRAALTPAAESPALPGIAGAKRTLLQCCLAGAVVFPWLLSLDHSWTQDFQPQGRYVLPMLVPMTYFVVRGLAWVVERWLPRARTAIVTTMTVVMLVILVQALVWVVH